MVRTDAELIQMLLFLEKRLMSFLLPEERVITDRGYYDKRCVKPDELCGAAKHLAALIRARNETANGRMKQFRILSLPFRHDISKHSICFFAVLNITAPQMEENPLFRITF